MKNQEEIEQARKLVESGQTEGATALIKKLRSNGCENSILCLFEALIEYDSDNDYECIDLLAKFISSSKGHEKINYAYFTMGICLMNLGLVSEANEIFLKLPDSYPNIEKERAASEVQKNKQYKALMCYTGMAGTKNA